MVRLGKMSLSREEHLIFHGCVPVDAAGEFLPMYVNGRPHKGRAAFEAVEDAVYRIMDDAGHRSEQHLDLLWYLWAYLTFWIGTRMLAEPQTRGTYGEVLRTLGFATAPGISSVPRTVVMFHPSGNPQRRAVRREPG